MNFQTVLEELDRLYESTGKADLPTSDQDDKPTDEESIDEGVVGNVAGSIVGSVAGRAVGNALTEEDEDIEENFLSSAAASFVGSAAGTALGNKLTEEDDGEPEVAQFVLECANCGALVIKAETEVSGEDEQGLVNLEEACQYCEETAGYKVLGMLVQNDEDEAEIEIEDDVDGSVDDVEEPEEDDVVDETASDE